MNVSSLLRILALYAIIAIPFLSDGQVFTGGISAGIVGSQVDGDTHSGYNKAGVTAGGWVSFEYNKERSFKIGMNYIQKGSRHNPDPETGDYSQFLIRLGYVEMPFLYQYHLKSGVFLEGGLSLGVLLHSYKFETDGNTWEPAYAEDPFKLFDACFQAGMGYRISEKLSGGIRGAYSVLSIAKGVVPSQPGVLQRGQFNNLVVIELNYIL
jgi:hypothetical protein